MAYVLRGLSGVILVLIGVTPRPAAAQSAELASGVKKHRLTAELGSFWMAKDTRPGVAFGVGYGYRPVSGWEVGAGFRYFVRPAHTTETLIPQEVPAPGVSLPPPQHYVEEAFHMWTLSALLRGYLSLDAEARFELGLTVRAGILGADERAICCKELALAPDFRARITSSTAIAISPQLAIATTGADQAQSEDYVDPLFAYASLWLSVVHAL